MAAKYDMKLVSHYIAVGIQSLKRYRFAFFLSIVGLATAFALSLISTLLWWDATSSDSHWSNADKIYVVQSNHRHKDGSVRSGFHLPDTFFDIFIEEMQDIVSATNVRIFRDRTKVIVIKGQESRFEEGLFIQSNFDEVFNFPILAGDMAVAIEDASGIAISKGLAAWYFGDADPIGETVLIKSKMEERGYTVRAVFDRMPQNSLFKKYSFVAPHSDGELEKLVGNRGWSFPWSNVYFTLEEGVDLETFNSRLNAALEGKIQSRLKSEAIDFEATRLKGLAIRRFKQDYVQDRLFVIFLSSGLMLLIAVLNHIALSTAIVTGRVRDVSMRRILGATRIDIMTQYMGEAIIVASIAYGLGLILAEDAAGPLGALIGDDFSLFERHRIWQLLFFWGVAIVIGVIASLYPAWLLSKNKASSLLQGLQRRKASGGRLVRPFLVGLQTLVGLGLTFAAGTVYLQNDYLMHVDKGYEIDGLLNVSAPPGTDQEVRRQFRGAFLNELRRLDGVSAAATSFLPPTYSGYVGSLGIGTDSKTGNRFSLNANFVGKGYFETVGLDLLGGRIPVIEDEATGSVKHIVLNEIYARKFGWNNVNDAVGECIYLEWKNEAGEMALKCYEVVAIVENHHYEAGINPVLPFAYQITTASAYKINIRLETGNIVEPMKRIETLWNDMFPSNPFIYEFAEDVISDQYRFDKAKASLLLFSALGSLLLTIAGLYSLAKFVVTSRAQEIAIRRVVGATSMDVTKTVVLQLSKPVLIGAMLGMPISWFYTIDWLTSFTVRINPEPWHAVLVGAIGVSLFLLMVVTELHRAVRIRPAEALQHE